MFVICIWVYRDLSSSSHYKRYLTWLNQHQSGYGDCSAFLLSPAWCQSADWGRFSYLWRLCIVSAWKGYLKIGLFYFFSWQQCTLPPLTRKFYRSVPCLLLEFHEIFIDFCRTGVWVRLESGGSALRGRWGFLDGLDARNEFLKGVHKKLVWSIGKVSRVGCLQVWSGMKLDWILFHCGGDVGCHRLVRLWFYSSWDYRILFRSSWQWISLSCLFGQVCLDSY